MGWCLKWRNPPPLLGGPLALLTLTLDYLTGPYIQFPILHLLPVSFVAWYAGFWPGLGLAIVLSLIRLLLAWIQPEIWLSPEVGINTAIRMLIFSVFAYLVAHTAKQTRELQKEVHILEGLLPICSFC
jgi:hypothetical protein